MRCWYRNEAFNARSNYQGITLQLRIRWGIVHQNLRSGTKIDFICFFPVSLTKCSTYYVQTLNPSNPDEASLDSVCGILSCMVRPLLKLALLSRLRPDPSACFELLLDSWSAWSSLISWSKMFQMSSFVLWKNSSSKLLLILPWFLPKKLVTKVTKSRRARRQSRVTKRVTSHEEGHEGHEGHKTESQKKSA